jgi:uncharacterized alpha-E superfamily protein
MMLSRIARGLYRLGREVERAQNLARILEVNHKMNLERSKRDDSNVWSAISESFDCDLDAPDERGLYDVLVLSGTHPLSVRHCIANARDEGRAMRDHISEEMWLHLNRTHLELSSLTFEGVLAIGRSEFNRRIEIFADAFHGLAHHTMIRGEAWAFLQIGKLVERASMICRILDIKRKSIAPDAEGEPVDVHQWQALLRSLSGYEPYRRAHDARIVPSRVLEFVLKRTDHPRSLACTLVDLREMLGLVSGGHALQTRLDRRVDLLIEELRHANPEELLRSGSFEVELHHFDRRCREISEALELAYFTSLRPASAPILAAPGAGLVPQ